MFLKLDFFFASECSKIIMRNSFRLSDSALYTVEIAHN